METVQALQFAAARSCEACAEGAVPARTEIPFEERDLGEHSQVKVPRLLDQLVLKKKTQPPAPLSDGLPPAQVRRRTFRGERVRKRGGVDVFDTPEALALNEARMSHLESLGLNLAGKRVLDVGAGVGHLAARLQKMGGSVVCLEGRPENVEAMRSRYPSLEGHVPDVEN